MARVLVIVTFLIMELAFAPASGRAAVQACLSTPGAVVQLIGTPHLFIVDAQGVLHWGGDTRGLAGRPIDWSTQCEVDLETLLQAIRGDPWLSSGLPRVGEAIYLSKWEDTEPAPTLLHIQSIADVELFGITTANYGNYVIDAAAWQQRYGFAMGRLRVGTLVSPLVYAWPEADRTAYLQLLQSMASVLNAALLSAYQAGVSPTIAISTTADCERAGLADFDRNRNPTRALGVTQDCLARVLPPEAGGAVPGSGLPATPTNVQVTIIGANELRLAWGDTLDEIGFRVYGADSPNTPMTLVTQVPANVTSYSATGLPQNTTHCYRVSAVRPPAESPLSQPACATTPSGTALAPTAPVLLGISQVPTGTAATSGLEIDWTDTSNNETGFQIWRGDQLLATTAPNATSYIDYSWSPAMAACYRVIAINSAGQAASQPMCVGSTGSSAWPTAPADLRLSPAGGGLGLQLRWNDTSVNEEGFRIVRNGQTIATVGPNVNSYPDFNLPKSTGNCYRVIAFNAAGEASSPQVCQTP